jgi:uncharacterized membrane protein YccC
MAGESVSFRITRTTEDLAQTVAALSQRLVKLEQRFGALELQLERLSVEPEPDQEDLRRLDHVASLLADCRSLLGDDAEADHGQHDHSAHEHDHHEHGMAA